MFLLNLDVCNKAGGFTCSSHSVLIGLSDLFRVPVHSKKIMLVLTLYSLSSHSCYRGSGKTNRQITIKLFWDMVSPGAKSPLHCESIFWTLNNTNNLDTLVHQSSSYRETFWCVTCFHTNAVQIKVYLNPCWQQVKEHCLLSNTMHPFLRF